MGQLCQDHITSFRIKVAFISSIAGGLMEVVTELLIGAIRSDLLLSFRAGVHHGRLLQRWNTLLRFDDEQPLHGLNLVEDVVVYPAPVPPLDGSNGLTMNPKFEMKVIAAGEACCSASSDLLVSGYWVPNVYRDC
jgi:hypothetical protein